jgi:hypothetical protein
MSRTEERLKGALRDAADQVDVAPDAWQRNQERVRANRSARRGRILAVAASVAAVLLVTTGVVVAIRTGSPESAPPASGGTATDGPFADQNLLGEPVDLGPIWPDGQEGTWRAAITDTTGQGPDLCDEIVGTGSGSASCAAREEGADDPTVAVDWFTASRQGSLRTLLVGVDDRVAQVDLHLFRGQVVETELHKVVGGWEDVRIAGHWTLGKGKIPQRLVAYDREGRVLQAIDLPSRIGGGWLPKRSACSGDPLGSTAPEKPYLDLGTSDALVVVEGEQPRCIELDRTALAGWVRIDGDLHVLTAPEAIAVTVVSAQNSRTEHLVEDRELAIWNLVVIAATDVPPNAELVALDGSGAELDRAFVDQPRSP